MQSLFLSLFLSALATAAFVRDAPASRKKHIVFILADGAAAPFTAHELGHDIQFRMIHCP